MNNKDYYATLGVSKDASADEIKSAYRKLAKKYHPDINAERNYSEERIKDINEAYRILSDDFLRAQYEEELKKAIWLYQNRDRRFGGLK